MRTYPLKDALANSRLGIIGYIRHSCPSLLSTLRNQPATRGKDDGKRCQKFNQSSFEKLHSMADASYIVLTSSYVWHDSARNRQGERILIGQGDLSNDVVVSSLRKTAQALIEMGAKPVIVMSYPTFSEQAIRSAMKNAKPESVVASTEKAVQMNANIRQALSDLDVHLIDPVPILCGPTKGTYQGYQDASHKWIVWKDGDHLSYYGGSLKMY